MIDAAALRRHRIDRGLSQRQLAAAVGVGPVAIKRIEDAADPGDLPLRVFERLRDTLGANPAELLVSPSDVTSDSDLVEAIGGTLLTNGRAMIGDLARALDVSFADVAVAMDVLALRLKVVGMSVARDHDDVWLVQRQPAATTTTASRPLSIAEARLLRRIHRGEQVTRTLSSADRQFTLPGLQRRGLVHGSPRSFALSPAVEASLVAPCAGNDIVRGGQECAPQPGSLGQERQGDF